MHPAVQIAIRFTWLSTISLTFLGIAFLPDPKSSQDNSLIFYPFRSPSTIFYDYLKNKEASFSLANKTQNFETNFSYGLNLITLEVFNDETSIVLANIFNQTGEGSIQGLWNGGTGSVPNTQILNGMNLELIWCQVEQSGNIPYCNMPKYLSYNQYNLLLTVFEMLYPPLQKNLYDNNEKSPASGPVTSGYIPFDQRMNFYSINNEYIELQTQYSNSEFSGTKTNSNDKNIFIQNTLLTLNPSTYNAEFAKISSGTEVQPGPSNSQELGGGFTHSEVIQASFQNGSALDQNYLQFINSIISDLSYIVIENPLNNETAVPNPSLTTNAEAISTQLGLSNGTNNATNWADLPSNKMRRLQAEQVVTSLNRELYGNTLLGVAFSANLEFQCYNDNTCAINVLAVGAGDAKSLYYKSFPSKLAEVARLYKFIQVNVLDNVNTIVSLTQNLLQNITTLINNIENQVNSLFTQIEEPFQNLANQIESVSQFMENNVEGLNIFVQSTNTLINSMINSELEVILFKSLLSYQDANEKYIFMWDNYEYFIEFFNYVNIDQNTYNILQGYMSVGNDKLLESLNANRNDIRAVFTTGVSQLVTSMQNIIGQIVSNSAFLSDIITPTILQQISTTLSSQLSALLSSLNTNIDFYSQGEYSGVTSVYYQNYFSLIQAEINCLKYLNPRIVQSELDSYSQQEISNLLSQLDRTNPYSPINLFTYQNEGFSTYGTAFEGLVAEAVNEFGSVINSFKSMSGNSLETILSNFQTNVGNFISSLETNFENIIQTLPAEAEAVFNEFLNIFQTIDQDIQNIMGNTNAQVENNEEVDLFNAVTEFENTFKGVVSLVANIENFSISPTFKDPISGLSTTFNQITSTLESTYKNLSSQATQIINNFPMIPINLENLNFESTTSSITSTISGISSKLVTSIETNVKDQLINEVKSKVDSLVNIENTLPPILTEVLGTIQESINLLPQMQEEFNTPSLCYLEILCVSGFLSFNFAINLDFGVKNSALFLDIVPEGGFALGIQGSVDLELYQVGLFGKGNFFQGEIPVGVNIYLSSKVYGAVTGNLNVIPVNLEVGVFQKCWSTWFCSDKTLWSYSPYTSQELNYEFLNDEFEF